MPSPSYLGATSLRAPSALKVPPDDAATSESSSQPKLSKTEIRKLHLQLRHGSKTAMEKYLKTAGLFCSELDALVREVLAECACVLASAPKPHAKISTRPQPTDVQEEIHIHVIYIENKLFLHCIDACTAWSETGHLSLKCMAV